MTIKGGIVETLSVDCRFQIVMAPKKSELPISLREKIVSLRENGLSYREIGKKVNVCFSTVRYIIKRHKERGYTSNNLRSGRPKKLSLRIKRNIIREASKNPFVSAITLANDVASTSGVQICAQSVQNVQTPQWMHFPRTEQRDEIQFNIFAFQKLARNDKLRKDDIRQSISVFTKRARQQTTITQPPPRHKHLSEAPSFITNQCNHLSRSTLYKGYRVNIAGNETLHLQ
ncbi:hypothetical protein TNIN_68591 [Trichonephila inaurata madagascariensis]|uniref:Sleeping Beauty transposase HTH domain-containing protein n=1 Tax=Trichonephila inaurata madagascariensis TaxID=2747483 RepID=A0A8X6WUR4_9ARAC|nr:hypothetical protein TNIN_68591 [Trichonephila inaurata madagascariensis]